MANKCLFRRGCGVTTSISAAPPQRRAARTRPEKNGIVRQDMIMKGRPRVKITNRPEKNGIVRQDMIMKGRPRVKITML